MKRTSVTIVGMGPRGLSVFERIAARAREHPGLIQLNLIDPSFCGPGVHTARQPQHLLTNTPAGQITIFPAPGTVEHEAACVTPTLAEWARAQGYRRFGAEYHRTEALADVLHSAPGGDIHDGDYLPRQLLGRYLAWAFNAIAASVPPTVVVQHLRHRAIDMVQQGDGSFVVELDSGFAIASDYVFLATGHSANNLDDEAAWLRKFAQDHARYNSRLCYLHHAYPLDQLAGIGHDAQVGIQGLGLSAHDVIAELTLGRGGRFDAAAQGLRYQRSGQEPALTLFSRSGLPAAARAVDHHGGAGSYPLQFFTREAVRDLRLSAMRQRGSAQLDFERELLPLLMKEMGFAWCCAEDLQEPQHRPPDPVWYNLGDRERRAIEQLLFPLRGKEFATPDEFAAHFRDLLESDLAEALRGNGASPLKAAAEVLGEARAVLQDCVEHGGLQAASHRKFMSVYSPAITRVAFGPPITRNQQLLALMDAGVLRVADAPNPLVRIDEERSQFALHCRLTVASSIQHLDALVVARLEPFSPELDVTLLMRNLLKRGLIRPYYNGAFHPGGIDIDVEHHPLNRAGAPLPTVWALGCLTEGAQFHTDALPRPALPSRPVQDAERCVQALFAAIGRQAPARPGARRALPSERLAAPQAG